MDLSELWGIGLIVGCFVAIMLIGRFVSRYGEKVAATSLKAVSERMEALFRTSFPELQPHFHPARVHEFVKARRARTPSSSSFTWNKPAGFPAAARAEMALEGMRDKVRLVDATGALIAEFVFEEHAEGGVIRLGKGKFTVGTQGPEPRVRYWHPEREFKWTPRKWSIKTAMSESVLDSSDSSSTTRDSTSSSSATTTAAAAGAGIVAAGGSFDGGGASAAWDDSSSGSGGNSSSGSDSSPDFSSVDSGSSSSSSTSY